MPIDTLETDLLVVGCGVAGLSAAVTAKQEGLDVIVLERSPKEERGGNSRHTGAWMRMNSETEVSDDFIDHFVANAGPPLPPALLHETTQPSANWPSSLRAMSFVDPEVIATFADCAPEAIGWLKGFGLRFARLEVPFLTSVQPRIAPSGGGLAIVEALAEAFEAMGGRIIYESAAQRLVQNSEGRTIGVTGSGPGNQPISVLTQAVILASGGFQGNQEMMTRYLGPRAVNLGMMSSGCHYNKGEGIQMALDIGAAPCGEFGSWHASPMDPRSSRAGASVYIYPYGVLVNRDGQRFVDEAPGPTDETYEAVARTINAQPGGIAYAILDQGILEVPHPQATIRTEHPGIEAPSIAELSARLGLPVERTVRTVEAFNAACQDGRFAPTELDGLSTTGLDIEKSHWARALKTPPFIAYPIISSIVFTFGGLRVNADAQVVNQQGDPIPGLYAAGEAMGLYFGSYTGATSVLKGLVFGRQAARHVAREGTPTRRASTGAEALADGPPLRG